MNLTKKDKIEIFENAIIVSFGFIDIWPKKIGFKNAIKKTILETLLLNIIFDIFEIPIIVLKEKNKLIKWCICISYLLGIICDINAVKVSYKPGKWLELAK